MNKSADSDIILLLKAGQGEAESFGILFDRYSSKIFRFIYYKVSVKEVAEDLASQCFLKIWEHITSGGKIKQFQPFVYRVARNLVIDYYRTRAREELPLIYQDEAVESDSFKYVTDQNLDKAELEKILFKLNSEIREIVLLRFVEGLSIKEIAKIVDKSAGNIRVIIHRALKELNNYINHD